VSGLEKVMPNKLLLAVVVFLFGAGAGAAVVAVGGRPDPDVAETGEVYRIVNPLAEVEVGEWAHDRLGDGKTMRLEVLEVHPVTRVVKVREETRDGKTDVRVRDVSRDIAPNHFLWGFDGAGALVARIYEDPITVAGRTFKAFCVETSARAMGPVRHWYSPEVPVIGLIRQERMESGPYSVQSELVDWSGKDSGK
jgi:hypothetical protein